MYVLQCDVRPGVRHLLPVFSRNSQGYKDTKIAVELSRTATKLEMLP